MAGLNQARLLESCTYNVTTAFERGPKEGGRNNTSWDVRTLCKAGRLKEALHILNQGGTSPNSNTYVSLLQECIEIEGLWEGKQVHAHIILNGFKPNIFLFNTLVSMYAKCGSVVDARRVFDKMPERDVFTWTIMMTGYAKHGFGREALEIYEQMVCEEVMPTRVTFMCVLKACASLAALQQGREVHTGIIKARMTPDIILENTLVNMYAKCGSVLEARQVFDKMADRDVVSWSAMISGYAQNGCSREALQLFERMQQEGLKPNVVSWNAMIAGHAQHGYGREAFKMYKQMIQEEVMPNRVTFICILNACVNLEDLEKGKEVHADIIKAGIVPDVILETALVSMYAKCRSMRDARLVFDYMAQRNVVSWTAMITGYTQHGYGEEALETYDQMRREGVLPNCITFISVLKACATLAALEKGMQVHAEIGKAGPVPGVLLENALIDMYAKCGSIRDSHKVFDNMIKRDVVSWNTMVAAYAQHGLGREAFEIYEQMLAKEVMPDKVTFLCVLRACGSLVSLEKGIKVHADIIKARIPPDILLENTLIDMYAKCGSMKDARQVFNHMGRRDVVSWNAMIGGYAQHRCGREAFETYELLIQERVLPCRVTFVCVLKACASLEALRKGMDVHADIIKAGIAPDIFLENTLIDMYAKCGSIRDAREVFDSMAKRDVVSWNVMIAGYAQHACGRETFEMYEHMIREGMMPDRVTFICILNACASLAALEKGKEVHADVIKAGIVPDINLETALADMYAKCGSMKDACQVFDNARERNVVSWNVMIAGYGQHGRGFEALQLFEQLQLEDLKPNVVTFICLLSACSHVGLVDEGCHYFDSMASDHGLTPTMEHFACMVDLLGRAGRLDEAENFINNMPINPDATVWGALLGACRVHGDVEAAERAAKCLLKRDPQDAATYVLLLNIYAAAGRWDDTAKVRKMMKDVSIREKPCRRCIVVNNRLHPFNVDQFMPTNSKNSMLS